MEILEIKRFRSSLEAIPGSEEFLKSLDAFGRIISTDDGNIDAIFIPHLTQDLEIKTCVAYKLNRHGSILVLSRFDSDKIVSFNTLDEFKKFILQEIE